MVGPNYLAQFSTVTAIPFGISTTITTTFNSVGVIWGSDGLNDFVSTISQSSITVDAPSKST
jgi:hypothetical protein